MPFSTYLADKINNHILRGDLGDTVFEQPTQVALSLHDSDPGPTNNPSTEISGGSYEQQVVSFGISSDGICSNSEEVVFSTLPTVTVTHLALWDQLGNMLWYDDITPVSITNGDNLYLPVGAIRVRQKQTD